MRTIDLANRLNCDPSYITNLLRRHPELRPAGGTARDLRFTEVEAQAVADFRASNMAAIKERAALKRKVARSKGR